MSISMPLLVFALIYFIDVPSTFASVMQVRDDEDDDDGVSGLLRKQRMRYG